ncbi:MAG: DUF6569 family protein [Candidatus Eisenbacteria bacterium]
MMKNMTRLMLGATIAVVCVLAIGQAHAVSGNEVTELIETLEVGDPVYYKNLTIVPIYTTRIKDQSRYTTLDEALDNGLLEIKELEGGRVPQVELTNRSDEYIFLMGGEVLTGCKQDRLVGRDVLIKPKSRRVIVPVYCVEASRWTYESDSFYSKRNLATGILRAKSQKAGKSAQSDIWDEIKSMSGEAGVSSPTSRLQAVYESEGTRRELSGFEDRMEDIPHLYPDVIGAVVGVGDEITSVDVFANPVLFQRLWPKLLKSAALSAISHKRTGSITQGDAVRLLRMLHDRRYKQKAGIDLGFELSVIDDEVNVNALVYRNAVVHLAGFPEGETACGSKTDGDHERRIPVIRRP